MTSRVVHWDTYYSNQGAPLCPSQFGVFIQNELPDVPIADLGCGSGRDTFFFADQGRHAVGIDGSGAAISACTERVGSRPNVKFIQSRIDNEKLHDIIFNAFDHSPESLIIYARFFLHAINESEELSFWKTCREIAKRATTSLAVEFRTTKDRNLQKVTSSHYRRYLDPLDFSERATHFGFKALYFVEGFGYAKFGADDAHVARFILQQERL